MNKHRELMNIVIVGHVDHGKSTLVGRLMCDTDSIPRDKFDKVKRICDEQGKVFEYAFLLDAFEEEQKQGITIDVSQIRFSTKKRDYLIIDTPGHKEFLKNMFSGASAAEAALILIDAREGIKEQTKQHAYILKLLGIDQIVVVVNKIDLVDYSKKIFSDIRKDFERYLETIDIKPKAFIPVAALNGDNIVKKSKNISWYKGDSICGCLDKFQKKNGKGKKPFRMFIQDVYKFDERRIIVGKIESGSVKVGDEVLFLPGNKTEIVKSIETWPEKKITKAIEGESTALTLNNQIFIERGQLISHTDNPPYLADEFAANIFWMGIKPVKAGQTYIFRLGTQEAECTIEKIKNVLRFDNSKSKSTAEILRHDAAEIVIRTKKTIAFDDHFNLPSTGRFVIVDKNIVSGGGVAYLGEYPDLRKSSGDEIKSQNITWHYSKVTEKEREAIYGHKGAVIWLTGLSGSGKSTIAVELEKLLFKNKIHSFILDGDNIRHGLNSNLGFSPDDRVENLRRIGEVAKLFASAGLIAITAFISPYEKIRKKIRNKIKNKFIEVYLDCPIEICEKRDVKGLYLKARKGQIKHFTGISAPYEVPKKPEIKINTDKTNLKDSVEMIVSYLKKNKFI